MIRAALLLAVALGGCAAIDTTESQPADAELGQLMADVWQDRLRFNPYLATQVGEPGYNHQHPDLSPAGVAARQAADRRALARLKAIDAAALDADGRLNHELLRWLLEDGAGTFDPGAGTRGHRFATEQLAVDTLFRGPQHFTQALQVTPFRSENDYRDYLARLRGLETVVQQTIDQLQAGIEAGRTVARPVVDRVIGQTRALTREDPDAHPLFRPFTELPDGLPATLTADGRATITDTVIPAYRRFLDYLVDDYRPAARETIAATALPDGEAFYAFAIRQHTTGDLDAETIHRTGLAEVERIAAAMAEIRDELGYEGSLVDFGKALREDPRYRFSSGQQALDAHRAFAKRIDPLMTQLVGKLPRAPYGVEPMPEGYALAGGAPYYNGPSADGSRPGNFYVNTHKPELQPVWSMPALVAHEAVPGHHLQIALAVEMGELPAFRRYAYYTAYAEGWALYAESLGDEVGMYATPEQRFGRLSAEIWRAVRLVVDTGMHARGWSRQQAIDFAVEYMPEPLERIEAEIDRYIAWPGQALAYKIGQLKISELRARAAAALGEAFDKRAFHDAVLGAGSMPLAVLEQRIEDWIAAQQAG